MWTFRVVVIVVIFLGISIISRGQSTIYNDKDLKAGSSLTPYPYVVNASAGTIIYESEYEIIFGPDCSTYPTCSGGSNNYFYTTAYDIDYTDKRYFLARLVPPAAYAELKKQLDGSYCQTIHQKLYFKYVEKYIEGNLNYQIYDYQRNAKLTLPITIPALILPKKVGDNYLTIDLSLITNLVSSTEAGNYYTLEVTNEKNEKTVLRFRYSPNE